MTCKDEAVTWTPDEAYLNGLDFFGAVVDACRPDCWSRPTPCSSWRALDVLGHVGASTSYGIALLSGEQPQWRPTDSPGDAVEGEPQQWWGSLSGTARRLVAEADLSEMVDSPGGRRSVGEGLSFPAIDLFVHAWDIARSCGIEVEIPAEAAEFTHAVLDAIPSEQLRSPAVFAGEVSATPGSTPTDAFVAWTGRDPAWTAQPGNLA